MLTWCCRGGCGGPPTAERRTLGSEVNPQTESTYLALSAPSPQTTWSKLHRYEPRPAPAPLIPVDYQPLARSLSLPVDLISFLSRVRLPLRLPCRLPCPLGWYDAVGPECCRNTATTVMRARSTLLAAEHDMA